MPQLWWLNPETFPESQEALVLLTPEERAQHQRFIPPLKRHEYLVTRVLLKTILGRTLGIPAAAVQFTTNQWGRPELSPPSPLRFSVTHTEGLIALLLSDQHEAGVDTERTSRAPRLLALAPNVFAPAELSDLAALPTEQQAHRALVLWTLKESYIKARGMGLALALEGFAFRFGPVGAIRVVVAPRLDADGARWQFETRTYGEHLISTALSAPAPVEVKEALLP
jgi:4'-phosphopantetheinyl transferase